VNKHSKFITSVLAIQPGSSESVWVWCSLPETGCSWNWLFNGSNSGAAASPWESVACDICWSN